MIRSPEGLQQALWQLGGTPAEHRTDSLKAAVKPIGGRQEFTERYRTLTVKGTLQRKRFSTD
jgi:hypothetical protein